MIKKLKQMRFNLVLIFFMLSLTACHKQTEQTIDVTPDEAKALYAVGGTTALGKADAPVTMVEIFAYDCRYCRQDYPLVRQFAKEHPNVRVIFKPFMAFGDRTALLPQYAALAAGKQGKFLEMHHALMTMHHPFTMKYIDKVADHLSLNMQQFHSDMEDPLLEQQIRDNTELMNSLNIDAIPAVIMTQTRLTQSIQDSSKIPQYIQVGFLSNDLLVEMLKAVQKDIQNMTSS